jgi:hypothetical protein
MGGSAGGNQLPDVSDLFELSHFAALVFTKREMA